MEERTTFGKFIMKKRKEKNLTQRDLAEELHVTESAVSKWERGISYPDITLVAKICELLEISEHELITASEDYQQREVEGQAKTFRNLIKGISWVFYISYGVSLAACFICNLAIDHTLSWFFIVLTAEMVAFSLTSLPILLKKNRGLITAVSFFVSLCLLLWVCCVYTGGNWFYLSFVCILFGCFVLFLPCVLRTMWLPKVLSRHKTLIYFVVNSAFLYGLLAVCLAYTNDLGSYFTKAVPIISFSLTLPWLLMIVIRYVRINSLFRTAICLVLSGIFEFLCNPVLAVIIDRKPFQLLEYNFVVWTENYINGNINLLITGILFAAALVFAVGGIVLTVRKDEQ